MILSRSSCTVMLCLVSSLSYLSRGASFTRKPASKRSAVFLRSYSVMSDDKTAQSVPEVEDYNELPPDFPRRDDALVALAAVRKACTVTNKLQPESADGIATVSKLDLSPVSVADFAAQAVVLNHLHRAFQGKDSFIAEESSGPLEEDQNLAEQVMDATSMETMDLVKTSIDLGKEYEQWETSGGRPTRVWCLDPIDGTKGFLRGRKDGGQYCVALALLEDGFPTVGILGCPNLPSSATDFNYKWKDEETFDNNQNTRGCIFVASRDGGCYQLPYVPEGAPAIKVQVTPNDGSDPSIPTPEDGRFCISVENFSDALGQCAGVAKVLHGEESALDDDGEIIKSRRIDSQAKYGVLARAGGEYYARFTKPGYVEWIWDHAAGNVVIEEAGGTMTDTEGNPIDFSLGPKMSDKVKGILGSPGGKFHTALLDAFQKQEVERLSKL